MKARIKDAWGNGRPNEAYGLIADELRLIVVKTLLKRYGHAGFSYEDAEDACQEAIVDFIARHPGKVTDPANYIFRCAVNSAKDELSRSGRIIAVNDDEALDWLAGTTTEHPTLDADEQLAREGFTGIAEAPYYDGPLTAHDENVMTQTDWDDNAVALFEAVTEEEVSLIVPAVRVVQEAVQQLPPRRKQLAYLLLEHGPTCENSLLSELLGGNNPNTTRGLKMETLRDLRELIPQVAGELDITLSSLYLIPDEQLVAPNEPLPTPEEGDELSMAPDE